MGQERLRLETVGRRAQKATPKTMTDGRTLRHKEFGVVASPRRHHQEGGVSPRVSALSSRDCDALRARRSSLHAAYHQHLQTPSDDQLPRWLKHCTSDNWNSPSYVYSPGISAKCHFRIDSKFHWKPPVDDRAINRARLTSSCGSIEFAHSLPRRFDLPLYSFFASAPSSPRLHAALMLQQGKREDMVTPGSALSLH